MTNLPYYKHPTVTAVARVLHDEYGREGGIALLRAAHRIRLAVSGTELDLTRVSLALNADGFNPTIQIVGAIIAAVRDASDWTVEGAAP